MGVQAELIGEGVLICRGDDGRVSSLFLVRSESPVAKLVF
jgi:hypothetical protein